MEERPFQKGEIAGVEIKSMIKYVDQRGWLCELFRHDELAKEFHPTMCYISNSRKGVARGPHEHEEQADLFGFVGPGNFKITLWDNRPSSPTYWNKMEFFAGGDAPKTVLVPPGVVHAYQNMSDCDSMVYNFPNQLFMGEGKREPIDEIRHEADPNSPFKL